MRSIPVLFALLSWVGAQEPASSLAEGLAAAREIGVRLPGEELHGSTPFAGLFATDSTRHGLLLRDLPDGARRRVLPEGFRARALTGRSDPPTLWVANSEGEVWQLEKKSPQASEFQARDLGRVTRAAALHVLAVSPDGRKLAWHDQKRRRVGVHDLEANEKLWSRGDVVTPARSGRHRGTLHWIDDTRLVSFVERDANGLRAAIVSATTGKPKIVFRPYMVHQAPGWAPLRDVLVHGHRDEDRNFRLRAVSLEELEIRRFDADPRGRHFIDLHAAPDRRHFVEWDFEEERTRVYGADGTHVDLGVERSRFLGFALEVGVFTGGEDGEGLRLFDFEGRELVPRVPALQGMRLAEVEVSGEGRFLLATVRRNASDAEEAGPATVVVPLRPRARDGGRGR